MRLQVFAANCQGFRRYLIAKTRWNSLVSLRRVIIILLLILYPPGVGTGLWRLYTSEFSDGVKAGVSILIIVVSCVLLIVCVCFWQVSTEERERKGFFGKFRRMSTESNTTASVQCGDSVRS